MSVHAVISARRWLLAPLIAVVSAMGITSAAVAAVAPQPPPDISKLPYQPIGQFKPGETLMPPDTGCADVMQPLRKGEIFNPSGTFNSFDTNVFEVICYPFRGPGDTTDNDPLGNRGAAEHGRCGGAPQPDTVYGDEALLAGVCDNHQLEWSRYYAATMQEILGDFGVTIRQYFFDVEDPGPVSVGGVGFNNTRFGRGINTAAVVPGADNPDETIILGAHYDKTNDAPAAAWDSQEGHAEMIRIAKLMADYWRSTGTRPSATIKFIPWEAEESGTLGSLDYAMKNVVPGEEFKVRGYWNTDPCAGGYPSYRYGNPADRIRMGIQLADPGAIPGVSAADATRITEFNKRAPQLVEDVLDHVDDTADSLAGPQDVFISSKEGTSDLGKPGGIAIGTDRPVLFASDWRNFETLGIPFFNPGPEVTGPNQESNGDPNYGADQSADALFAFHTPLDNLQQLMRFTGGSLDGNSFSGSWAKGMEFCSHLLAWGMLQPDQGGAQRTNDEVVSYFEALPNEAFRGQRVTFDADGSYAYADHTKRTRVPESRLRFAWDFGDGATATGKKVQHAYAESGLYPAKLTVTDTRTKKSRSMSVPITVENTAIVAPILAKPAAPADVDGTFDLKWEHTLDPDDADTPNFEGYVVEEAKNSSTLLMDSADDMARWVADTPEESGNLQPWQLSDSDTDKPRGNKFASEPRAFWSGPATADTIPPAVGPGQGETRLVLKDPITLPRGAPSLLAYASDFGMDNNDEARVEVAVDDGSAGPLDWQPVDEFRTSDDTAKYALGPDEVITKPASFEQRVADLARFAGRRVRIRFVLALGDAQFVNVIRTGWYVDDVRIITGAFKEIGRTGQKEFTVSGKSKAVYGYRVRAAFKDGITSLPSNAETVEVTVGVPERESCAVASGFRRASARAAGRGLRFDLSLTGQPATVDVFRASRGSRAVKARKVVSFRRDKSFRWSGKLRRGSLSSGLYYVRLTTKARNGRTDRRTVVFERRRGRFVRKRTFHAVPSCKLLSSARLSGPVFTSRRKLGIVYRTSQPARVSVALYRGKSKRAVRRLKTRSVKANRTMQVRLSGKRLRRGEYRVVITAVKGKERVRSTLASRRL